MKTEKNLTEDLVARKLERLQEYADEGLRADLQKEIDTIRAGRKAFPKDKLRRHKVTTCFNDAEYAVILEAAGGGEIAETVRTLSLEAAKGEK